MKDHEADPNRICGRRPDDYAGRANRRVLLSSTRVLT